MAGLYLFPLLFVFVSSTRTSFQHGDPVYALTPTSYRELPTSARKLTTYGEPIISDDCNLKVVLFKYSRCGGLAPNGLQGGITEDNLTDGCFAQCPPDTSCFRQNQWYWQCLPDEDLPEDPAWAPLTTCECSGISNGQSPPPPPLPPGSPPPPNCTLALSDRWTDFFNIYSYFFTTGIQFSDEALDQTSLKDFNPFLGEGDKCGNENPFFQLDLCMDGLVCMRKDLKFMQCVKLPELGIIEEGGKCGDELAYDIVTTTALRCAAGTACLSATPDGTGPWTCTAGGGFWQAELLTNNQCAAFGKNASLLPDPCGSTASLCTPLDPFFGMCVDYSGAGVGKKSPGEKCGSSSPYDDGFKPFFCEKGSNCLPVFGTDAAITEFQCVKSDTVFKMDVDAKCGDFAGPFNGVYTCDSTGQVDSNDALRLCLQISTDDWRCRDVTGFDFVEDDGVCGSNFPYSTPAEFCLGINSSCFLHSTLSTNFSSTFKCSTSCPSDWDCSLGALSIPDLEANNCTDVALQDPLKVFATKNSCGPLSDAQFQSLVTEGETGKPATPCPANTYCTQKDILGIYQCLPVAF